MPQNSAVGSTLHAFREFGQAFSGAADHVKVDEVGTEAAAATEVMPTVGAYPAFIADHPSVFAIRDQLTGAILFLGRVEDPSAS